MGTVSVVAFLLVFGGAWYIQSKLDFFLEIENTIRSNMYHQYGVTVAHQKIDKFLRDFLDLYSYEKYYKYLGKQYGVTLHSINGDPTEESRKLLFSVIEAQRNLRLSKLHASTKQQDD